MAMRSLTKEEAAKKFPSLAQLSTQCGECDSRIWGLYQKGEVVVVGLRGTGWKFQCSLDELYERAMTEFGKDGNLDTENILLVYGIEYNTNNLRLELRDVSACNGSLQYPMAFNNKKEARVS